MRSNHPKQIVIFGAGYNGQCTLNKYGSDNIYCFVDNYKKGDYLGKPIINFSELCKIYEQYDIIIACAENNYREIETQLQSAGINNYYKFKDISQNTSKFFTSLQEDCYIETPPSIQNAIDIFKGSWVSNIPIEDVRTGQAPLFDDWRIKHWNERYPVNGKTILELGPLECGHTYMLEKMGSKITSIEANRFAYLKCLIIKEVFGLNVNLMYGDFRGYLQNCNEQYDIVLASGVLYHMADPVQLILDISKITNTIFLWTHYYSDERKNAQSFDNEHTIMHGKYIAYKQNYFNTAVDNNAINSSWGGGSKAYSYWLDKNSLLNLIDDSGFNNITIIKDDKEHVSGCCITLIAHKN